MGIAPKMLAGCVLLIGFAWGTNALGDVDGQHTFTHNGFLYGISDSALLVHNIETGEMRIEYADGGRFQSSDSDPVSASDDQPLESRLIWISKNLPAQEEALCASEASAAKRALTMTQGVCANLPGECDLAQDVLQQAQDRFAGCIGS